MIGDGDVYLTHRKDQLLKFTNMQQLPRSYVIT